MFTVLFWSQTIERALKSGAQALLVVWGSAQFNALTVNWTTAMGIALASVMVSLLTSLASLPFGPTNSPSLVAPPRRGAHEKVEG